MNRNTKKTGNGQKAQKNHKKSGYPKGSDDQEGLKDPNRPKVSKTSKIENSCTREPKDQENYEHPEY